MNAEKSAAPFPKSSKSSNVRTGTSASFLRMMNKSEINRCYLGRDKATNVISFSMREGEYGHINPQILGDVVISVETARRDAIRAKLMLEEEIDFLLIHGILHLLGYNHENTSRKEAKIMYDKERDVFRQMNSRKNMPAQ